jgi:hypothetical protein
VSFFFTEIRCKNFYVDSCQVKLSSKFAGEVPLPHNATILEGSPPIICLYKFWECKAFHSRDSQSMLQCVFRVRLTPVTLSHASAFRSSSSPSP